MSWIRTFRHRPLLALILSLLVLATGIVAVGAHHDHDTGHHADCPTCRLADEAAGAVPVVSVTASVILPGAPFAVVLPATSPAVASACDAHRLRAPPQIG